MRRTLLAAAILLSGCTGEVVMSDGDAAAPRADASATAGPDGSAPAPVDAGSGAHADAAAPAGEDASSAARSDAAVAAGPDASTAAAGADASAQASPDGGATSDLWITAYLAGWNLNSPGAGAYGTMPVSELDYSAFTHGILFALTVNPDGTLAGIADWDTFAPDRINAVVSGAHAANKPILFTIGGAGDTDFATALGNAATRATLVSQVIDVLTTWKFDGVDLDLEPIASSDEANYKAFVNALAPELAKKSTPMLARPVLTAAMGSDNATMFAALAPSFDQINLMTYDMSGAWGGWVTWHNSPIYDGSFCFPSTGGRVPSADGMVAKLLQAGVPAKKIGIGMDFYGYVWSGGDGTPTGGASAPRQSWTTAPTVSDNIAYTDILGTYYQASLYHWDDQAQAAYLGIDQAGSANDKFISYDDETTAQKKVDYVRSRGIGGLILWEVTGDYLPSKPAGQRQPLLSAVKSAAGL
jgi:chitinase